jgi:hypothetical protein
LPFDRIGSGPDQQQIFDRGSDIQILGDDDYA